MVLDDAWSREVLEALDVLDARTESCLLVTTRLKVHKPEAMEPSASSL